LVQADAGRLPLAGAAFDGVVCANSFPYFRQPVAALREMRRVLRPGGLVRRLPDVQAVQRLTDPAYFRTYTVRGCEALLEQAGLKVLHRERFRVGWVWGLMRFGCRRGPG
jgi:ubiquinone/menaquinone biosynthesis C-methylase UbiE